MASLTKMTPKMTPCVVGRMPNELLRKRESRAGGLGFDP